MRRSVSYATDLERMEDTYESSATLFYVIIVLVSITC